MAELSLVVQVEFHQMRHGRGQSSLSSSTALCVYGAVGISLALAVALPPFSRALSIVLATVLSTDLGNALAAVVAVGGYMFEHWNARRAQQLDAQMNRVSDQSHKFLVPVTMQFHSIVTCSIMHFVDKHLATVLETNTGLSDKERLERAELYAPDTVRKQFLNRSGTAIPTNLQNPATAYMVIIECMLTQRQNDKQDLDRAGMSSSLLVPRISLPRELPPLIHEAVLAAMPVEGKAASPLWSSYECFIRYEFVPGVERIAEIIDESGDLMEPVPSDRLEEVFGRDDNGYGQVWKTMPRMWFYSFWLAYARAWRGVVHMWDDGVYSQMRPNIDFPAGLLFFNVEGQSIVAKVEKEIVGMSQMHGHGK